MSIDKETVLKTAKLARLKIDDDKIELYTQELSKIIAVVDTLKSANTDNIAPMTNVNEHNTPTRKDEVTDGNCTDKIFKNAPKEKFGYFLVPKVID
jgi:aspartyl-tRNA(Asn)/glutamyl-tRNA(Gln) amidotransferase subunit C